MYTHVIKLHVIDYWLMPCAFHFFVNNNIMMYYVVMPRRAMRQAQ
jgi:hypothetical protein